MKFARYLEETQVPEWKKAYIDYRGLKKRITAIRKARENRPASPVVESETIITRSVAGESRVLQPSVSLDRLEEDVKTSTERTEPRFPETDEAESIENIDKRPIQEPSAAAVTRGRPRVTYSHERVPSAPNPERTPSQHPISEGSSAVPNESSIGPRPEHPRSNTLNMGVLPRLRRRSTAFSRRGRWELTRGIPQWDMSRSIPLKDLLPMLTSVEKAFFDKLDIELDKVETFYVEREKEMRTRMAALKVQLQELKDHRRLYHELQQNNRTSWLPIKLPLIRQNVTIPAEPRMPSRSLPRKRKRYRNDGSRSPRSPATSTLESRTDANKKIEEELENVTSHSEDGGMSSANGKQKRHGGTHEVPFEFKYDPEDYYHAKKKLKKAVLECYRGLEILNNYRVSLSLVYRRTFS
ncbi:hypothetical protein K474DRAFT_1097579 [Panus rudis PR-1116 ss-1]|nr:hypothetical protein K474DRAFT_1097579 [Panus rudis PR-1116 ss-1]